jgi:hypothetical protein
MALCFLALLSVTMGPALAFSCCCSSDVKAHHSSRACHEAAPATTAEKPTCHDDPHEAEAAGETALSGHHDVAEHNDEANIAPTNKEECFIGHHCQCQAHNNQPLTATETKTAANAFAFVALSLPVRPFVAVLPPLVLHWTPAQAHAPPAEYVFASLPSRAPPVF